MFKILFLDFSIFFHDYDNFRSFPFSYSQLFRVSATFCEFSFVSSSCNLQLILYRKTCTDMSGFNQLKPFSTSPASTDLITGVWCYNILPALDKTERLNYSGNCENCRKKMVMSQRLHNRPSVNTCAWLCVYAYHLFFTSLSLIGSTTLRYDSPFIKLLKRALDSKKFHHRRLPAFRR